MTTAAPVIRKQISVNAPRERAFRVFTQNIDTWWPRQYQIGKSAMKAAVLEPQPGGRWYEIGEDGQECDWGRVLVWEPPQRLVLAWQITGEWRFDASFSTEVEVTFTPDGPDRTLVELEHRQLERFGDAAPRIREQFEGGWAGMLGLFAQAASQP